MSGYRQNFRPTVSIIVTILLLPASPFLRDTATPRTDSFYYCGLFHALSVAVRTKARLSQGRREILETNDTATNAWARDDPTDTEIFPWLVIPLTNVSVLRNRTHLIVYTIKVTVACTSLMICCANHFSI